MSKCDYTLHLTDENATLALGQSFAPIFKTPLVIYLQGDLGAGKTTFTRGLLQALGFTGHVKSPTYALVESYYFDSLEVHHFDLYRFTSPDEWLDAGFLEFFTQNSICLIEWPEQAEGMLPAADFYIQLAVQNQGRTCTISPHSIHAEECFSIWLNSPAAIS